MRRSEHELDELIREALGRDDAEIADRMRGSSVSELLTEVFRGRNRRLAMAGAAANLILFVAALWCGWMFLQTREVDQLVRWGLATVVCLGAVLSIKIWYWLEMQRLALTRDLKRLELRVVQAGRGSTRDE